MRQEFLLEVSADRPTHHRRLQIFKRENGIVTHNCDGDWMAAHMPLCRQLGYGVTSQSSLFDCVAKVGRLMDEAELTAYAKSERGAVRLLCEQLKQPFTI